VTAERTAAKSPKRTAAPRPSRKKIPSEKDGDRPAANATIRFLSAFCRDHPLDEKNFVAPSFSIGRQIGQALARAGEGWVNLRFMTLPALAHETAAAELVRLGREQLSETGLAVIIDTLFRELKERVEFEYFDRLRARPGVARALLRAVQALRLAGLESAALVADRFCVPSKGQDTIRLLARYEKTLEDLNALDLAGLYAAARGRFDQASSAESTGRSVWYLCLEGLTQSRVEADFLTAVAGNRLVVVPRDPAFGLERPRGWRSAAPLGPAPAPSSDAERLSWLFDPAGAPPPIGDGSITFFRAVGQTSECREVIRRILTEGAAFDGVEVVAPPGSVYAAIFHSLAVRCGIPVSFADGLPLHFTTPGRVFAGLADWVEGRYPVSILCHLVESGDLALPVSDEYGDAPGERLGRILRNAMIGWGRDRYLGRLNAYRKSLEAESLTPPHGEPDEETAETPEELNAAATETGRLTTALESLLALLPPAEPGDKVDFSALASGLAGILGRFARVRPSSADRDQEALDLITAELDRLAREHQALAASGDRPARPLRLEDALERLRAAVASLTVGASPPLAGHLHVSSFVSGGYAGRPLTFIVGLDDTAAPGEGPQDPILLDAERQAISDFLPTTADALKANLYSLATLVASLRGRVVLSYACHDIMDERRLYPSSMLLQALRLARGAPWLDYSDLDDAFKTEAAKDGGTDPTGFVPDRSREALDERDWWLMKLGRGDGFADRLGAVEACFPTLREGMLAASARAGDALSAFEGVVTLDRGRFDPVRNHGLVMSASRLELLAKCPYGYFLRYVLGVEPPRDLELDRSRWLDPLQRGSLIHQVLYEFMSEVAKRGERVSAARHSSLMDGISGRVIQAWRDEVPPPSDGIFDKERRDVLEALAIFLRIEEQRPSSVRPVAFEKKFNDVTFAAGPGESFKLRGFIDRIDRTGPGTFRIVDYKTGSYRDFEDFEAFGRGRRIQPALYALAAEEILKKEGADTAPHVTESGYFFPTRRGEGREIMVGKFDRQKFRELLADLLALIAGGYFVTTTRDECGFCDFAPVCGDAFKRRREKVERNPAIAEALDRLKRYA
jgi:ATP-dependent helicase/nuclease subunit B